MKITSVELKNNLKAKGATIVGIADISELEETFELRKKELKKYTRAIAIGVKLSDEIIDEIAQGPTERYARHYREKNKQLDRLSADLAGKLKKKGFEAMTIPASKRFDQKKLAAKFPHKTTAILSGLGWIGRNALFISFDHGPRVRLTTVFTNAPLETDKPQKSSNCKSCKACVNACPVGAIKGKSWTFGMAREKILDAHKCYAHLKTHEEKLNETICGICVNVCPIGKTAK